MTPKLITIHSMIQQAEDTPISDAVLALLQHIADLERRLAKVEADAKAGAAAELRTRHLSSGIEGEP